MVNVVFWRWMREETVRVCVSQSSYTHFYTISVGKTTPTNGSSDEDLSIGVLTKDAFNLLVTLFPDPKEAPTLLVRKYVRLLVTLALLNERYKLVGHSMGGSVLVRVCPMLLESKYRITGVTVLDVVEGGLRINL